MTIHLPETLESSIRAVVDRGEFASVDDAMTKAALLLLEQLGQGNTPQISEAGAVPPAPEEKPIWDVIDDLRKSVPPEEFSKLPRDGAAQLDHYLYGSPRHPTA